MCSDLVEVLKPYILDIYESLGYGHNEVVYHNALKVVLKELGLKYETEFVIPICFHDHQVGYCRADLIVDNRLVIEIKSLNVTKTNVENAENQCLIYLRYSKLVHGLVIIFPRRDEDIYIKSINC
jgi:GxxExxY protein